MMLFITLMPWKQKEISEIMKSKGINKDIPLTEFS